MRSDNLLIFGSITANVLDGRENAMHRHKKTSEVFAVGLGNVQSRDQY
jgi:hypothetical protein